MPNIDNSVSQNLPYNQITGQKAVQEREIRQFKEFLDNLPFCFDAFDAQGNIVFWNKECEKITGYSSNEIIGNPNWMERLYPDANRRRELLGRWAKIGNNFRNWEIPLWTKDGSEKIISWTNISDILDIPGWDSWAIGYDVSQYVLNHQKQELCEQQLRTLFRIQKDLQTAQTPGQIANTVLEHLQLMTQADGGLILRYDFEHERAEVVTAKFEQVIFHHAGHYIPLKNLAHLTQVKQGHVVFVDDLSAYNENIKLASLFLKKQGMKKAILVPLMDGDIPLGSLSLYCKTEFGVGKDKADFLRHVGSLLALRLKQGFLVESLQNKIIKLEQETLGQISELKRNERRLRAQYESIPVPTYTWQKSGDDFILTDYNDMALATTYGKIGGLLGHKASEIYESLPELVDLLQECYDNEIAIETQIKSTYISDKEPRYLSIKLAYVAPDSVLMHIEDITEAYLKQELINQLQEENRRQKEEIQWFHKDINALREQFLPFMEQVLMSVKGLREQQQTQFSPKKDVTPPADYFALEKLLQFWRDFFSLHALELQPETIDLAALIQDLTNEQAEHLKDFRIHIYLEVKEIFSDAYLLKKLMTLLLSVIVHHKPGDRLPILRIISMQDNAGHLLIWFKFNGENLPQAFARVNEAQLNQGVLFDEDVRNLILVQRMVHMLEGEIRMVSTLDEGGTIELVLPDKAEINEP